VAFVSTLIGASCAQAENTAYPGTVVPEAGATARWRAGDVAAVLRMGALPAVTGVTMPPYFVQPAPSRVRPFSRREKPFSREGRASSAGDRPFPHLERQASPRCDPVSPNQASADPHQNHASGLGEASGVVPQGRIPSARGKGRPRAPVPPSGPAAPDPQGEPNMVATAAWIGIGPGLNEPAGFAVDLDRVLRVMPRRNLNPSTVAPRAPRTRRTRGSGRWSAGPFAAMGWPSVARIWSRGKGWRR
jgi:hypothetical protein